MVFLKKNSFRFRRMWRKLLESIDKEPTEETPTMKRLKTFDPEEYERAKAYVRKLRGMANKL